MRNKILLIFFLLPRLLLASDNTLRVAVPNPFGSLEPANVKTAQELFILPLIFEPLVFADPNDDIKNILVKNWEFNETKKLLDLTIMKEHKFSDGSRLTAQDVYNSLFKLCAKGRKGIVGIAGCPGNPKMRVTGDYSIEIDTNAHASTLLYQLASGRGAVSKLGESNELVGSGPYKIKFQSGNKLILEKNPFFWNKKSTEGSFRFLEFNFVPSEKLKLALDQSQYHEALMYLSSDVSDKEFPNYFLVQHAHFITQVLSINPNTIPFDNIKIRQAFALEIHRNANFNQCHHDIEKAYGFIPPGIGGSISDIQSANELALTKSNYLKLFPVLRKRAQIKIYRHSLRRNECETKILQIIADKFNIELNFEYLPDYSKLFELYADKNTQGYVELMAFISRDATTHLKGFMLHEENKVFFSPGPEYDSLMMEAWSKPVISDRFKLYRKANNLINSYASLIPLYYVGHSRLVHHCLDSDTQNKIVFNPNSFLFLESLKPTEECKRDIKE